MPHPARRAPSVQTKPPARPTVASLHHVPPVLPKLPPQDGETHGHQQQEAAGHEVSDGKEVVLTPEPGQRGQDHQLLSVEGLRRKVWKEKGSRFNLSGGGNALRKQEGGGGGGGGGAWQGYCS